MPVVWSIGGAYFALKLIRYSILFWLPFYLRKELGYSDEAAGYLSTSFEVGGIVGAVVVGLVSDRYFLSRRRELASGMIALLAGALLLYTKVAGLGPAANFAGMALVGFCLFGPDALISGAAAQDLGGEAAAATAAGAINGLGSIGAILQGSLTSSVSTHFGWNALYYLFVVLAVAGAAALRLGSAPRR
jgi:sugar phosphate permease